MWSTWLNLFLLLAILALLITVVVKQTHTNNLSKITQQNLNDFKENYNQHWVKSKHNNNNNNTMPLWESLKNIQHHVVKLTHEMNVNHELLEKTITKQEKTITKQEKWFKLFPFVQRHASQNILDNFPPENVSVSVLIPIYNGYEYLEDCLKSLKHQTVMPLEILIGLNGHPVDGEVAEHVVTVVDQFPELPVTVYKYVEGGKVLTLHKMMEKVQGSHVALLDVDDEWMPRKLEAQLEILKHFRVHVIGTQCQYFGSREDSPLLKSGHITPEHFAEKNQIINSSVLMEKSLARWNRAYEGIEDYEMWLRLISQGYSFYNVPEILVRHRIHDQSVFNTKDTVDEVTDLKKRYLINM